MDGFRCRSHVDRPTTVIDPQTGRPPQRLRRTSLGCSCWNSIWNYLRSRTDQWAAVDQRADRTFTEGFMGGRVARVARTWPAVLGVALGVSLLLPADAGGRPQLADRQRPAQRRPGGRPRRPRIELRFLAKLDPGYDEDHSHRAGQRGRRRRRADLLRQPGERAVQAGPRPGSTSSATRWRRPTATRSRARCGSPSPPAPPAEPRPPRHRRRQHHRPSPTPARRAGRRALGGPVADARPPCRRRAATPAVGWRWALGRRGAARCPRRRPPAPPPLHPPLTVRAARRCAARRRTLTGDAASRDAE